jgi:hypothetical protein
MLKYDNNYDNNMECASRACALLKHGFSNPNILPGRKLYAWELEEKLKSFDKIQISTD